MQQVYKQEMEANIQALISRHAFSGKAILLFGHCNAAEETIDYLLAQAIPVNAILDNNEAKQGSAYRDVPVKAPSDVQCFSGSDSIVLIATRFYGQMAAQLRRLGYDGEIVELVSYNSFAEYSLSDDTFTRKKDRVLRGMKRLAEIRDRYPSQHLVICPNDALGDVYWAMAFLPAYCKKHHISETIIIVSGKGCSQTAELFLPENLISLDRVCMDELVQAMIFSREANGMIAHHDRPYTDNIIKYLDKHFLSFIDYYKYAIYGLAEDALPIFPKGHADFVNVERFIGGKTVILSPYAKSVVTPPDTFWEEIAAEYRKKGYSVFTNVIGDEVPIKNTVALSIPINQMVAAVERAGCFIGVRSGLCDVLYTAKCRKIAVFPDCFYSTTPYKVAEFFALPEWESVICGDGFNVSSSF